MKPQKVKEPYNPRLDRNALHRYLYERSNRYHRIKIHQQALADALDVTRGTVTRIIAEFRAEGRLRKVESLPDNIGIYEIADPGGFGPAAVEAPKKKVLKWS